MKDYEFGEFSNEVNSIIEVGCMSMFIAGLYGGVMSSKTAYLEFFQNNQATTFKNHFEAKRILQDKVTVAFGKGAFRLGWRVTVFSTSYVTFTTAVSVYRGKNGLLEHIIGGGVAGSMYKFNSGPRAMLVGGVLGSTLGLVAGATTLLLLKLTGMEMSDVRQNSERWNTLRMGKFREGLKDHYGKKESPEHIEHQKKMEEMESVSDLESINARTREKSNTE
ncbi:RPII140-upstream gene protein isoform X2 [Atheta coriaria]|uniref:RPII140-upstream gene protein isoform X2 n=1 Tax=Dalotia coriaria TaxID=877792 RepID=UPI0031F35D96